MPKLEEQENLKLYYFYSEKTGRKMQKFSGDEISESDIRLFEIPDFLLEEQPKNNINSKYKRGVKNAWKSKVV